VEELILGGESDVVEFKSTLRYDLRQKTVNKKLEYVIAKTISAFLNSNGGELFIGVDDDQNALGLADDISTLRKLDIDGFELQLIEVINKYIGKAYSSHIKISFPKYDSKQICQVTVSQSGKPVFVSFEGKEDFFIRSGCSSQPLSREEQSVYEKEHWE
jgi:predicted HTH transcriptional regulator